MQPAEKPRNHADDKDFSSHCHNIGYMSIFSFHKDTFREREKIPARSFLPVRHRQNDPNKMNRNLKLLTVALVTIVTSVSLFSCNNSGTSENKTTAKKEKTVSKTDADKLPNYRYVDLDTLLSKYNLAKDYNEEIIRMQTNMENEVKGHQSRIQNLAVSIDKKMRNNGYLTEASYKQDQEKINNMQSSAQKRVASLQSNFEAAAIKAQKAVNDSIETFIKSYNENHGYDAIFFKAATLYIDPRLDITDEVLKGLNERYNKIKK